MRNGAGRSILTTRVEGGDMESRGWEGIVLYPVPIDRIAEVQALLAAPRGTWMPADPAETPEEMIVELEAGG